MGCPTIRKSACGSECRRFESVRAPQRNPCESTTCRDFYLRKGQDDLLTLVNAVIAQMKADGTLRQLHEKYGLVYGYELYKRISMKRTS